MDRAAVVRQRLALYTILDRLDPAVDVGLEFLTHVGIKWSPHPTNDELAPEYNRIWQQIGDRSIEQLVALPPMRDTAWASPLTCSPPLLRRPYLVTAVSAALSSVESSISL